MIALYSFSFFSELVLTAFWSCWSAALLSSGYSIASTATLLTGLFIAQAIFEIPTGIAADRFGRKASTLCGLVIVAVGFFILSRQSAINWAIAGFFISGLGITLTSGARASWLLTVYRRLPVHAAAPEGKFFFVFNLIGRVATIIGALVGILVIERAPNLFWTSIALLTLMTAIFGGLFVSGDSSEGHLKSARLNLDSSQFTFNVAVYGLAVFAYLFFGIEQASRNIVFAPYLISLGLGDYRFIAYAQIILATVRIFGIVFLGGIVTKFGTKHLKLLLVAPLFIFGFAELFSAFNRSFPIFICLYVFAVFTLGWHFPMRDHYINEIIPERRRATFLSIDSMVLNCGSAFALILISHFKIESFQVLWLMGAVGLLASASALLVSAVFNKANHEQGQS